MIYSGDIILNKLAGQHQHMFAKVEVLEYIRATAVVKLRQIS